MRLGKVVKSNSHCDYVVEVDDERSRENSPKPEDYGFGRFVTLKAKDCPTTVGLVYNSQLFNPMFLNMGPRLSSEPDPLFTPDLIVETRTLLGIALIGTLETTDDVQHGIHGIPRIVIPVNTPVCQMSDQEIYRFHLNQSERPQFCYYSHLLRSGGMFAAQLIHQVLEELIAMELFDGADQRALAILCKELSWKTTMGAMR
ncbi:MAG TPA: hypothetical protein IGS53_13345 [Leptolyngbyaceae cyanobacterium M33_DOE_097]|uniref:DUF8166 domain-containing protein n=1 Tax=Oscillatoriales cyanobacterium SpSt-418 TaxID=2282169 RepID=A0A7C3KE25_9CYAN|nr:hypothetical protein [Leptolyngbyaceae cyanobacterium M33_DOE_097]